MPKFGTPVFTFEEHIARLTVASRKCLVATYFGVIRFELADHHPSRGAFCIRSRPLLLGVARSAFSILSKDDLQNFFGLRHKKLIVIGKPDPYYTTGSYSPVSLTPRGLLTVEAILTPLQREAYAAECVASGKASLHGVNDASGLPR